MEQATKTLVTESWEKVLPIQDKAGEIFYDKLFELDPGLTFLFKGPIPKQIKLLMGALDAAVKGLDDLDTLVPILQEMGKRHAGYGVIESDYGTVGTAFIDTLATGLGDAFTDDVKGAWLEVYGVVSSVMIEAAKEVEVPGPISPREVRLVQGSWEKVTPIADQAATIFYDKLFELDPSLESMFPDELDEQKKKLMQMLTVAVKGLTKLESIVPAVQSLGARHVGYGVKDEHYDTVGEAFIFTLDKGLGEAFTDDVKKAWLTTYTVLADTMKAAAAEAETSPAAAPEPAPPTPISPAVKAVMAGVAVFLIIGFISHIP